MTLRLLFCQLFFAFKKNSFFGCYFFILISVFLFSEETLNLIKIKKEKVEVLKSSNLKIVRELDSCLPQKERMSILLSSK